MSMHKLHLKMILLLLATTFSSSSCRQKEEHSETSAAKYIDVNTNCRFWAASGECSNNPNFMLGTCPNACADVGVAYNIDLDTECPAWAARGECSRNPGYMGTHCRPSCTAHYVAATVAAVKSYKEAKEAAAAKKAAAANAQENLDRATAPTVGGLQTVTIDGKEYPKCQYLIQKFTRDSMGRLWGWENNMQCILIQ